MKIICIKLPKVLSYIVTKIVYVVKKNKKA